MYGVPADLDLRMFLGTTLVQICLGPFDMQFRFQTEHPFEGGPYLQIEGYWELRAADGEVLDHSPYAKGKRTPPVAQRVFRAHSLLGRTVASFSLEPPESLTLVFDDGQQLRVFDDSDRYESFAIQPGDIFI